MEGCVSNLMVCNLAYSGKLEELKESIQADKSLATRTDQNSWSPLHIADSAGRDEIVKALLGKGAQVNAVDQNGCTLLHYAASKNRHEITVMLLEGGANPDAKDHYEATAMHQAAERVEEAKQLVSQGASIYIENKEEKTPLQVTKGGLGLISKRMVEG
uniref:Uncharacterized protein n=1 Tax=Aotus nancymaae TaxID=37293 RepID=A0A2K5EYU1_AOTNA